MADWIKMRTSLESNLKTLRIARELGISPLEAVGALCSVASWFQIQGKFGKVKCAAVDFDHAQQRLGLANALMAVDWMREHHGVLTIHGFSTASPTRKGIKRGLRRALLAGAKCAACSTTNDLQIDHKTPVVRGGTGEVGNLQVLCGLCNRRKGGKTMAEFMA